MAFSTNGLDAHFGFPVNGGAPDRISGGSSSGSVAAVSGRLCDFALGTDTGGSARAPASHCGLYGRCGLRPTHGRISLQGALDLSPSFDTCGWFTRDVSTFARVADKAGRAAGHQPARAAGQRPQPGAHGRAHRGLKAARAVCHPFRTLPCRGLEQMPSLCLALAVQSAQKAG